MATWEVSCRRVLGEDEVQAILRELRRRARRAKTTYRLLIIFELATCCGLRVSEICGLTLSDVRTGLSPAVRIRRESSKSGRARSVPLDWDALALADVTAWIAQRIASGAGPSDLLLPTRNGCRMHRSSAQRMYARACAFVGRKATIHDGRHTFISWALERGVSAVEVKEAAGHANLATTTMYAHKVRERRQISDLFSRTLTLDQLPQHTTA